jgi:hypothetical protein
MRAETDLASLHYTTFVEPLTVLLREALSFDSDQFANNSIKLFEAKNKKSFLLQRTFLRRCFDVKKLMKFNSKTVARSSRVLLKNICA